jgi:hypothetical protein
MKTLLMRKSESKWLTNSCVLSAAINRRAARSAEACNPTEAIFEKNLCPDFAEVLPSLAL